MNLIEAIKSGKPFRRKGDIKYYIDIKDRVYEIADYCASCEFMNDDGYRGDNAYMNSTTPLFKEDIVADDWEIKGEDNEI